MKQLTLYGFPPNSLSFAGNSEGKHVKIKVRLQITIMYFKIQNNAVLHLNPQGFHPEITK